jgi:hypothetical protein
MIVKIISGFQRGADIAAIRAAKAKGLETGGCMPLNFLTLDGPMPQYATLYGATQHSSAKYPPRTYQNVRDSDGTMRFAIDWQSRGELCTLKAITSYGKPYHDVDLAMPWTEETLIAATRWIIKHDIRVLNVAGNAIRTIEPRVELFVTQIIEAVQMYETLTPCKTKSPS